MTSEEINTYIAVRNGELCSDEIALVTDIFKNPQLNHIIYENDMWQMWDYDGNYYTFRKRNW